MVHRAVRNGVGLRQSEAVVAGPIVIIEVETIINSIIGNKSELGV